MERKLRLLPPPASDREIEGAEPITEEERSAAEALADALARGDDPLAEAMRAAHAPAALDDADLEALVARAMGDEAAATRAEREAAAALARALDRPAARPTADGGPLASELALAEQLQVAARPREIDPRAHEALIEAALARAAQKPALTLVGGRSGAARRLAPLTVTVITGVTAIAAGLALFFGKPGAGVDPGGTQAALIRARSTQELFDAATPFPRSGAESARIDRIAAARGSDLRANRFASWGVR